MQNLLTCLYRLKKKKKTEYNSKLLLFEQYF